MKKPPTLADMAVALAHDKRRAGGKGENNAEIRRVLLDVFHARKFVLDEPMSTYYADLSRNIWLGGHRKRLAAIENMRRLSLLPHPLTWIEFRYDLFCERLTKHHHIEIKRPSGAENDPYPPRVGWIMRQHPTISTAFMATEIVEAMLLPGLSQVPHAVSIAWCTDDTPLPWPTFKLWRDEPYEELVMMVTGYRCPQVGWTYTYKPEVSVPLMNEYARHSQTWMLKPQFPAREFWVLLATLNDLPVSFQRVTPTSGSMSHGGYRHFVSHSIVHLTVPETRWHLITRKTAAAIRRRAHQVRGHWRVDWRKPVVKSCVHQWNTQMLCSVCGGHYIWIAEHERGDPALGRVMHDYEVTHA